MNNFDNFHAGFIAIIGRPNVGKSTLMNRILQQKVAIMSETAQTTRDKIQGIYSDDNSQIVFIDTPGVHKPVNMLDDYMANSWTNALKDVDGVLFLVSADQKIGPGDRFILNMLKSQGAPVYLAINKIDLISPNDLPEIIESYTSEFKFKEIIPISATNGNNIESLLKILQDSLPTSPPFYPLDQVTDHPAYFLVGEIIREKILELTHDEVPHSVAVIVERMDRIVNGKRQIEAEIVVERPTQKAIIIGKGGEMIKKIGISARKDIEIELQEKINLKLWVRVQKKWRNNNSFLSANGYKTKHNR